MASKRSTTSDKSGKRKRRVSTLAQTPGASTSMDRSYGPALGDSDSASSHRTEPYSGAGDDQKVNYQGDSEFDMMDTNKDNRISFKEFVGHLKKGGWPFLTKAAQYHTIEHARTKGDEQREVGAIVKGNGHIVDGQGNVSRPPVDILKILFQFVDTNKNGYWEKSEFENFKGADGPKFLVETMKVAGWNGYYTLKFAVALAMFPRNLIKGSKDGVDDDGKPTIRFDDVLHLDDVREKFRSLYEDPTYAHRKMLHHTDTEELVARINDDGMLKMLQFFRDKCHKVQTPNGRNVGQSIWLKSMWAMVNWLATKLHEHNSSNASQS